MDEKALNNCKGEWKNDCPYPFCECAKYKYDIGETCYIYFWDDYEPCKILDRKHEYGMNFYMTDVHPNWQKEVFLRKLNTSSI